MAASIEGGSSNQTEALQGKLSLKDDALTTMMFLLLGARRTKLDVNVTVSAAKNAQK